MKYKKKLVFLLILFAFLTIGILVIRINTFTPAGAIRYECLLDGHVFSAIFLQAKEIRIETDKIVYKITFGVPYDKVTATHLDCWNIIKNKNGTYSASYGGA